MPIHNLITGALIDPSFCKNVFTAAAVAPPCYSKRLTAAFIDFCENVT